MKEKPRQRIGFRKREAERGMWGVGKRMRLEDRGGGEKEKSSEKEKSQKETEVFLSGREG